MANFRLKRIFPLSNWDKVHFDPTWTFPQMKRDTTEVAFPVNIWFLFDLCGENQNTKSKDKLPLVFQIVPVKGVFRVGE